MSIAISCNYSVTVQSANKVCHYSVSLFVVFLIFVGFFVFLQPRYNSPYHGLFVFLVVFFFLHHSVIQRECEAIADMHDGVF